MAKVELPKHEELEELKGKTFTKRVALATALYAVVSAIAFLGGNHSMKHMLLAQQQASNQWAFYQAKSTKEHQFRLQKKRLEVDLAQHGPTMKPEARQKAETLLNYLTEEEDRYANAKKGIEKEARRLEQDRDLNQDKDPYFDHAEALVQIAIVMASIAILATSRLLFVFSLGLAVLGVFFTLNGFMLLVKIPFLHGGP